MSELRPARMCISIPQDAKAWLEAAAKRHCSTQNGEIIHAIRQRMEAEQKGRHSE